MNLSKVSEAENNMSKTKDEEDVHGDRDVPNRFDEILELAGSWGPWQKRMFVIISCSQIISALHAVAAVYLSASPSHICQVDNNQFPPYNDVIEESINNTASVQNTTIAIFRQLPEQCNYNTTSFNETTSYNENDVFLKECTDWIYDTSIYKSTAVTEWDLVCSRRWLGATVQATYMGGVLIGSIFFGQVSDRIGRRATICLSATLQTIIAFGVAFATSYWAFITLRFLLAFSVSGMMVTQFVLVMEITKPSARTKTGMLSGVPFGIGVALMGLFGYFFRQWRHLQISIAVFTGVQLLYFWLIPESPRWLVTKDRFKEALHELKKISVGNRMELPDDTQMLKQLQQCGSNDGGKKKENWLIGVFKEQATLVRTPILRRRCLIVFSLWCISSMIYYGLIFTVEEGEGAHPFLQVFIYGVAEIPGFILTALVLNKLGRRVTSFALFVLCSICLCILSVVPEDYILIRIGLATAGKLFDTSVFQLCYLYTSELAPTEVRNIAVGTSSMFARIGSSSAPYIMLILGDIHKSFPAAFFAVTSLVAAFLTLLLPETTSKPLPQTVEEIEMCSK